LKIAKKETSKDPVKKRKSTARKSTAKETKKTAAKKTTAKKATTKKTTTKKTATKKTTAKKATTKKTTTKKTADKKTTAKKATKKTTTKKTADKKTTAKKATKKTTTKKTATKKTTAKKATTKKTKDIHPTVNIGTAGHVDEGKSTLVQAMTGVFPDSHSEEVKRGITIRLGYADADIYECPVCEEPDKWSVEKVCPHCGEKTEMNRRVLFVDAPGHEILMQVMLSGAAIMDGVILVIGANKSVPQPQTREHLAAITALGINKVIIVQNKVELVDPEQVRINALQITEFLKGTIAEGAPIIPMSAIHGINLDLLLSAIQNFIPNPERDEEAPLRMFAARSFDINRPGTEPMMMRGGVFGGSIKSGRIEVGDKVLIQPGLKKKSGKQIDRIPIETEIVSIRVGATTDSDYATPGGLVAIQTTIDPSMTRSDNLSGCIITDPKNPLDVVTDIKLKYTLFDKVVGSDNDVKVKPIASKEALLLTIGTAPMTGVVTKLGKGIAEMKLSGQVAIDPEIKIAISRRVQKRWRLIGYGELVE